MTSLSCLGEVQLRLTVPQGYTLQNVPSFAVTAAGSEANVAGLVRQLGLATRYTSKIAAGPLGDRALADYAAVGVDLSTVVRAPGERLAVYYLEQSLGPDPASVVFDREHTPVRTAALDEFDWDVVLDARMFFSSGITAALSDGTRALLRHAYSAARSRGIATAFDVNHRTKLWSAEDAAVFLRSIIDQVDVLFCSHRDAVSILGYAGAPGETPAWLRRELGVGIAVTTAGTAGCFIETAEGAARIEILPVPILDRPGAGDAFVGGVLFGLLSDASLDAVLAYGTRASRAALTHHGDLTILRRENLETTTTGEIDR